MHVCVLRRIKHDYRITVVSQHMINGELINKKVCHIMLPSLTFRHKGSIEDKYYSENNNGKANIVVTLLGMLIELNYDKIYCNCVKANNEGIIFLASALSLFQLSL